MIYALSCHCGAVEGEVVLKGGTDTVHRCNCSYCSRRTVAAVVAEYPHGVKITKGAEHLTRYTFHTGEAQHYFCSICGVYTHHRRRANPDEYGVNLGCLDGLNPQDFEPIPWFDGRNHIKDRQ